MTSGTSIVSVTSAPRDPVVVDSPGRQPCVFLDRDGVINAIDGYVSTPEDLDRRLIPASLQALARLRRETNVRIVLVTNQGGVGAGKMSDETARAILDLLAQRVDEAGGHLDAEYYCPTSPHTPGPTDGVDARKPQPGMLLQAAQDFGSAIDLADSYMIGDMTTDIAAGERASERITSVLVLTGLAGKDGRENVTPDHVSADLAAAVDWIISREKGWPRA